MLCIFLNSCLILKSYIGKLQNESVNIQRALDFGILYQRSVDSMLAEHIDFNWAGSVDTRKLETCYVFTLGLGRQFHGKVSYNLQLPYPPLT